MRPRDSIIMPCFNGATHLAQSVGSVLAQDMTDWELILIDDGSTDNSRAVIEDFARRDSRIKPLHQPNAGLVATRNRGLGTAVGEHIGFLDADDTWHPQFLSALVGALASRADAGIAYCGWQNIGLGAGRDSPYIPPNYEGGDKIDSLLRTCPWPVHGALVRASLFREAGHFDESLTACEDYDLWLRLASVHRLVLVPQVLAYYHHHGGEQMTRNKSLIALNHLRAQEKFLHANPSVITKLGRRRIRELTSGGLLRRGYATYWSRDLPAARTIFRQVMRHRYGSPKDWLYMLPAWLPETWHRWLLRQRDRAGMSAGGQP